MTNQRPTWTAALRQQILSDRLLGATSVPIKPPPTPAMLAERRKADRAHRAAQAAEQLRVLNEEEVQGCRRCGLADTRTKTVFGQGDSAARLVFVGEAPGHDEDRQGLAFVGKAGQLLTKMIVAMGLSRDEVFICNVLKCRPPNNRDPLPDEILACHGYLARQLAAIQPEVIVALGAPASQTLLNTADSIGRLRGRFHDYVLEVGEGEAVTIPLMPTYHPAYLLRQEGEKRKAWDDLQKVMQLLGLSPPQR